MSNKIVESIIQTIIKFIVILFRSFRLKSDNKTTIILSVHKLGDSVFTLPAVKSITEKLKDENIHLFCLQETKPIFEYQLGERVTYHLISKENILYSNRVADKKIRSEIKNLSPGKIFDLTGSVLSASMIFGSNSKYIIGVNEKLFKPLYTHYSNNSAQKHLSDIYSSAVKTFFPDVEVFSEYPLKLNMEGKILIHPFAGWRAKEWGLNKFIELYKLLNKYYKTAFIFPEKRLKNDILREFDSTGISYIETKNINELIYNLSHSALLISNDSGPVHLASMLGIPTFTIFGPTSPSFHVPYGKHHKFIQKIINCSPVNEKYCFTFGGRFCPSYDCMTRLRVNEVSKEILDFISELGIAKKELIKDRIEK